VTPSAPGPVERLLEDYGRKGQWAELGTELDRMNRRSLAARDQEVWFHVRGIAEYRLSRRRQACEIFEAGLKEFPNSGWLNYGLGQEYEFQGRIDEMSVCFTRVRLSDVGSAAVLAIARYYYLWDRFDLAQQAIQPFFDAYYRLKILDDTFLYLRGLPFFGVTFGCRAAFCSLTGQLDVARRELTRARAELRDYRFERDELDLEATASGDWTQVLSDLDAVIPTIDPKYPSGQLRMKRAVLRSRLAPTLDDAAKELGAVQLSEKDHAWLEDVRTLAQAEACHRLGNAEAEAAALSRFWPRQGLLFEPNHAFDFGFLPYQERLKPDYRSTHQH